MTAYRRIYDTAKNRDQLRNPTLGNRVWATFTLFIISLKRLIYLLAKVIFCFVRILVRLNKAFLVL